MAVDSSISILIGATLGPLQKGLKKGVGLVKNFGAEASKAIAGSGGIGGAIAGALGGITVAAGLKYALGQFQEIEKASTKLSLALKANGNVAGVSAQSVMGYAKQLQAQTGVSVAATLASASALAKVQGLTKATFNDALGAATDMAAALGMDSGAAEVLASALANPRDGYLELAAAGVKFSDSQIDAISNMTAAGDIAGAQAVLIEAVKTQYDGAAEAAGNTLSGSVNKLTGEFSGLATIVGEALAPYIQAAVDQLTAWVKGLDTAALSNAALTFAAEAVGWIVDGIQVLNIAWKACQVLVDGLLAVAISGFRVLAQGVQVIVDGLAAIGVVSEGASQSFANFIDSTKQLEKGAWDSAKNDAKDLGKAWEKPWESTKSTNFFADVKKSTVDASKEMGKAIEKGPVSAMKTLNKVQIEAQGEALKLIKDLTMQNENFGLDDYQKNAKSLKSRGATNDQVKQVEKLGAQLKGKELKESLETPFEKFEREMKKLSQLNEAGGIDGDTFARAKGKLVKDFQGSLPDNKIQAGGPLTAGSQEARSAILSFRNAGRNNNPQEAVKRLQEQANEELKQQTRYLKDLAKTKPTTAAPTDSF